ncbi:hypothetical protein PO909_000241 [Leuciscus waleckii]
MTFESFGPNSRHAGLTDSACKSPRKTVLSDRYFRSADSSGSKGKASRAARTKDRSHEGTEGGRGGFIRLAPLRKRIMSSFLPIARPRVVSAKAAISATYTLSVEGDLPFSNSSCKKESTRGTPHARGSKFLVAHHLENTDHLDA